MATILRVKLRWSGFQGGPGYSIFHMRDFEGGEGLGAMAADAATRIDTFANGLVTVLAKGVQLQVQSDVEELEETTGTLVDIHSVAAQPVRSASSGPGTAYAAAVGGVINWRTSSVRNGRRIRGKTFLVPLTGASFEDNGSLNATHMGFISAAATTLMEPTGTPDLGVWARPTAIKDGAGKPTGEYNPDGIWHVATSFNVPDMGAVLRSRRD